MKTKRSSPANAKGGAVSVQSYREQRQRIAQQELVKHWDKWVAFRPDGTCIVASAKTLEHLDRKLRAAGEDPQKVVFEFLGSDDVIVGGAEFL